MSSDRPIRVLIVTQGTGRDRLLAGLIDGTHDDVSFSIVTLGPAHGPLMAQMQDLGVPVTSLGIEHVTLRSVPLVAFRLRQIVRQTRPDLIQSLLFYASLSTTLVKLTTSNPPPVLLARHHNAIHHRENRRLHVALDGWMARRADHVVAVSDAVFRTLISDEDVSARQISVVYNGLDWRRAVRVNPTHRASLVVKYQDRRLLVAAGRLIPMKDHPTMLKALSLVVTRYPDVHLVIAGTGTQAARDQLLSLTRSLDLVEHVDFAGWIPNIYDLMAAADIFVHSSFDESFCQVVVEAAGLGVPLATTTVGPLADIVGDWHPPIAAYDHVRLANRICSLLDRPTEARAQAIEVSKRIQATFTIERMAVGYQEIYNALL